MVELNFVTVRNGPSARKLGFTYFFIGFSSCFNLSAPIPGTFRRSRFAHGLIPGAQVIPLNSRDDPICRHPGN
jgi:hypothetical protein